MKVPITHKRLIDWAGADVVGRAEKIVERGSVLAAEYDPPRVTGKVLIASQAMATSMTILDDGTVENHCPCYDNRERGIVCSHVIALGVTLMRRTTDPEREAKYQAELRRASRMAAVDETEYLQRVPADTPGALPARLHLVLEPAWLDGYREDAVPMRCEASCRGARRPLDRIPTDLQLTFSRQEENILFVLEDIAEGPARGRLTASRRDFLNLVDLHQGAELEQADGPPIPINKAPMTTRLEIDLDRETGELIVIAHTELPFLKAGEFPVYLVEGKAAWVYGAHNLWPLSNLLPAPYHPVYEAPVIVPRESVPRFFTREMPALARFADLQTEMSVDLLTIEPAVPRFRLHLQGSPASLAGTLYAVYGDLELVAAKPDARGDFARPDPDDLLRYTVRNPAHERTAVQHLQGRGMVGECGDDLSAIVGEREVLNFIGAAVPALRRRGWRVDIDGRIAGRMDEMDFAAPVVHIDDGDGWFEVGFDFEDRDGASISPADIQLAIRKGDAFIKRGNRTILVDADAIESMQDVFSDCASGEGGSAGCFRMSSVYAGFVQSSLEAMDGIDVEESARWREQAAKANQVQPLEPVPLAPELKRTLRPYQHDGVNWLRFLECNGFAGILADEMGLGKTLQTLCWLDLQRRVPEARGRPALVVCPTSLVDNWAEEVQRFFPAMHVVCLHGSDRHAKYEDLDKCDVAITSYALLRRDLERLVAQPFAAAVLDEAQHIKNRSTQNAVAAKKLRAAHRLVLTGTPIENSVSDLWSIMDFLMPGYLGTHDAFKVNYEREISRGGPEGERAQSKLRRKIQPFMLRRLKTQVAADLPPKIERIQHCELTPDQRAVYRELLEASRRKIHDMVRQRGFNKCRMQILTTLMRLRQTCCHLDLLQLDDLNAAEPSAKTDAFFELLDEAIDGGHRVLVFSQFARMLRILDTQLREREIPACYLDGSTTNRMEVVHRFNTERDIPLFLISLKAGGTGLNLTGADMVVHFDPWWNPAAEDQATDRAHRIGQQRTVYSIKLITRGTVEEKVVAMQRRKRAVINATIEADEEVVKSLSWEDVQSLLEL